MMTTSAESALEIRQGGGRVLSWGSHITLELKSESAQTDGRVDIVAKRCGCCVHASLCARNEIWLCESPQSTDIQQRDLSAICYCIVSVAQRLLWYWPRVHSPDVIQLKGFVATKGS